MADKKVKKKRKGDPEDGEGPNKEETEVAKHLRFGMPTKKATMYGDEVVYFMGSKAVDFLMDSKWASGHKSSITFTHRESINAFLTRLLNYGLFNRVHLIKTEKKVKDKKKDSEKKKEENKDEKDKKEEKEKDKEKKPPASPKAKKDKDGKEVKKIKKKVKITLEPHENQAFFDGDDEVYMWIYDPVSWKTFIMGICLVIAIIAICLFPLWPESVREYSWYLSVAGAVFVGGILILAVLRYILYAVLWCCTVGKLHFWLLPNLTAECGFLESFSPLYEYTSKNDEKNSENKSEKPKDSTTPDDNLNDKTPDNEDDTKLVDETPTEEHQTEQNTDSLENAELQESEESSGSTKEEEWVKVKKGDAQDEEMEEKEEIKC